MFTDLQFGERETGEWKVSPSQIKAIKRFDNDREGCDRKWGYRYIDKIETPPAKAAQLGSAVHALAEKYFADGVRPETSTRAGKLASRLLECYPSRGQFAEYAQITGVSLVVEKQLSFRHEGVFYRGIADLLWVEPKCEVCGRVQFRTPSGVVCSKGHEGAPYDLAPTVADHKTSSDPGKWGLTEHTIGTDPQALIYSAFAAAWADSPRVNLQWTYVRTRGKSESKPVRATLTETEIKTRFEEHVAPHGRRILELLKAEKAEDLDANPEACSAFGGCPHAAYCPRTTQETLFAVFGQGESTMDLKAKLAAKHGKAPKKKKGKKGKTKNKNKNKTEGKTEGKGKTEKASAVKGRKVNSPEAPKDSEIAREISRAVGDAGGGAKEKKQNQRKIAEAAAGASTPEEAAEKANRMLDRLGRKDLAPQDKLLIQAAAGLDTFAPNKARGSALGLPWAHGRTVNGLKKAEAIKVEKIDRDGGSIYKIELLPAGRARAAEIKMDTGPDEMYQDEESEGVDLESRIRKIVREELRAAFQGMIG